MAAHEVLADADLARWPVHVAPAKASNSPWRSPVMAGDEVDGAICGSEHAVVWDGSQEGLKLLVIKEANVDALVELR